MLILIQERELYLQTSKDNKRITDEEKKEIARLKGDLSEKIKRVNDSIEALEGNPKIDSYFKALECYTELRAIIFELFKILFSFLFESIIKSLVKTLSNNAKNIDSLEEEKIPRASVSVAEEVYQKSFSLMSFSYLDAEKVIKMQSDIHDLYAIADENINKVKEYSEVMLHYKISYYY